jgi:hypothetical protein
VKGLLTWRQRRPVTHAQDGIPVGITSNRVEMAARAASRSSDPS